MRGISMMGFTWFRRVTKYTKSTIALVLSDVSITISVVVSLLFSITFVSRHLQLNNNVSDELCAVGDGQHISRENGPIVSQKQLLQSQSSGNPYVVVFKSLLQIFNTILLSYKCDYTYLHTMNR